MTADQEMILIFGGLHLVALVFAGMLFLMFLRSDTAEAWEPPDDSSGEDDGGNGGGNDRVSDKPKPRPTGGIPLPDAEPARVRLRGHDKLPDLRPRPARRAVPEPARTRPRTPTRVHAGAGGAR